MGANIKIAKLHDARREDEVGRRSANLFNKTTLQPTRFNSCDHGTYLTGGSFEPHSHPHMKEIFYFIRGTGTFTLDGVDMPVKAGSIVVVEPNRVHRIVNDGTDMLQHIVCSVTV